MLKIVNVPNSVLSTPVKPIKKIDSSIKKLVKEMIQTLQAQVDPQGVGLAAPQVGVSIALFIMQPSPEENVEVMINPKIQHSESVAKQNDSPNEEEHEQLEGCLSIPRIWSPIKRHDKIILEYQDIDGDKITKTFEGFEATIVQHEMDHLNGILFTQRAVEQNQDLFEEKKGKLKKIDV